MTRLSDVCYRVLLTVAFPASFRRRHGPAMFDHFTAQRAALRDRPLALVGLWLRAIVDAVVHGLACRLRGSALRRPRPAHPGDRGGLVQIVRAVIQEVHMPRLLRGHRGYAVLAVSSLSLAVGATLVVFTVVNGLWLTRLPVPELDRVVMIVGSSAGEDDPFAWVGLEDPTRWSMFETVAGQVVTSGDREGQTAYLALEAVGRIGAAIGLVVAAIVSRLFVTALPGLSTLDPFTYGSVALLMTTCAAGAGLSAAWRLRRVAPAEALRAE